MTFKPSSSSSSSKTMLFTSLVLIFLLVPTLSSHNVVLYNDLAIRSTHNTTTTTSNSTRSLLTTGSMSSANVSSSTIWVGWSFCNQANEPESYTQALHLPSPRRAICPGVTSRDNDLTFPQPIPFKNKRHQPKTPDEYARAKELYLSRHCCNDSTWVVMFKSGNMDRNGKNLCRETEPSNAAPFNELPMNQPLMVYATVDHNSSTPYSYFAGTYDVDLTWNSFQMQQVQAALHQYTQAWMNYYYDHTTTTSSSSSTGTQLVPDIPSTPDLLQNKSFLYTGWIQTPTQGLVYSSMLRTSVNYPWLMNYLRANDRDSSIHPVGYGGYPWKGAGNVMGPVSATPSHQLILTIRMAIYAKPSYFRGLFYMPEFSACWKRSDGSPCDPGDDNLEDNLTRYLCYSVTKVEYSPCQASSPQRCPPWHFSYQLQEWISAHNTTHYPYECYHQYCGPYSGKLVCDPYSNPIPQELVQIKTCKEWGYYGFPTEPLPTTNVSDATSMAQVKTWTMNVGALGNVLYFYDAKHNNGTQAPISKNLPRRSWISFDVGPEIGVGSPKNPADAITETRWEVSQWDLQLVQLNQNDNTNNNDNQHVKDNDDDNYDGNGDVVDENDDDDGFGSLKAS